MATDFSFKKNDDDEEDGSTLSTGGGVETGNAKAAAGGSPNASASSTGGTRSGSFTNLNSYLDANSGKDFGSQVAGKVQGEVDQAGGQIDDAANQFKSRADQGAVNYDQGITDSAINDPSAVLKDQGKLDAFTKQRDATYGGPSAFSQADDLYNQADTANNAAQEAGNATQTEGGRFSLLDRYFQKPTYTHGQKSLDDLLLEADPSAGQGFQKANQSAKALGQRFQDTQGQLDAYAGSKQAATADSRAKTRAALGIDDAGNRLPSGALQSLDDQLSGNVAKANAAYGDDAFKAEKSAFGVNKIGGLDKYGYQGGNDATSGYNPEQGQDAGLTYGVDPGTYFSHGTADEVTGNSASDLAKKSALAKLAGQPDYNFDATKAGTFKPGASFDSAKFANDRTQQKARYTQSVGDLIKDYQSGKDPIGIESQLAQLDKAFGVKQDPLANQLVNGDQFENDGKGNWYRVGPKQTAGTGAGRIFF